MPKSDKLTVKQKKFVKAYVATDGNGTQAALQSYNTTDHNSANQIALENLQKPTVREAIEKALIKHGITVDAAIEPIRDGLVANKGYTNSDGDEELTVVPDYSVRLKASGMALKLLGADKGEAVLPAAVHFHQHIESKKTDYEF